MHKKTGLTTRAAATACIAIAAACAAAGARATVIDFETPLISGGVAEMPGDGFASQGVVFRTVRLSGTVTIGATITLADQNNDVRIYRDATAISGEQLAGPALGGTSNDLLMRFASPLATIALTSDDAAETANTIRLIALAETTTAGRYRVIDFVEALDDAIAAPGNRLALAPSETFSFALFEIRTQQEGFDDLTFTLADSGPIVVDPPPPPPPIVIEPTAVTSPSSLVMLAGALGSAAAARRQLRMTARRA